MDTERTQNEEPTTTEGATPLPVGASRRKNTEKPETLAPKIARLTVFTLVLALVVGAFTYERARGQLGEALLGAGAQMMMIADADRQDAPRRLFVNGQSIHFSTGVAPVGVDALLDRFETVCERIDAGLMERMHEALARHPDPEREAYAASASPVLRDENGGAGYVACLDLGSGNVEPRELLARFERFEQTRDLHAIGDLRYVYAAPMEGGRSHFVALWTEGTFRFDEVFPDGTDARGTDPEDIPRPPGARRTLSAYEEGDPQRATFYATDELDEGGLVSFYRRELASDGWTLLAPPETLVSSASVRPALVAQRGDRMIWLAFTTDFQGRVNTAVIETGGLDAPGAS
ncbi:hypothetical protein [Sandaracinus amylolyticus]|nr:hypothetical protein [Sandaracinus amylolyticus]